MRPRENDLAVIGDPATEHTSVATEWQRRARREGLTRVMRASQPADLNHRVTAATREIVSGYLTRSAAELGRPLNSALEVGCGVGRLTPWIAAHADRVTALDMTDAMLDAARRSCAGLENVHFVHAPAERLPRETVDVAVSVWVLMHILDEERLGRVCRAIAACSRYLVLIEYDSARIPVSQWSCVRPLEHYLSLFPGARLVRRTELDYGGDRSAAALVELGEAP